MKTQRNKKRRHTHANRKVDTNADEDKTQTQSFLSLPISLPPGEKVDGNGLELKHRRGEKKLKTLLKR